MTTSSNPAARKSRASGASKLNLRILDQPVHYQERIYGVTKMTKVFRNGLIMLRMCGHGFRRLKLGY